MQKGLLGTSLAVVVLLLLEFVECHVPICSNRSDCTVELQQALDAGGLVTLTAAGSPWITQPLIIHRNNTILHVEDSAMLLAKRWAFKSVGASLVATACTGITNFTLRGSGTLRMWRSDYNNPKHYKHAEWRMAVFLCSTHDTTIDSITLEESGGDGIYVGGDLNTNLVIKNTLSRNNYRQGISVISVDGLTVTNCIFEGTKGTPPMAGVDFEPNFSSQMLSNILFQNVTFRNNSGWGIAFALHAFDNTTRPVSIRMENILIEDAPIQGGILIAVPPSVEGGHVSVNNALIRNTIHGGIDAVENGASGPSFTFSNMQLKNTSLGYVPIAVHANMNRLNVLNTTIINQLDQVAVSILCRPEMCASKIDIFENVLVETPFPVTACGVNPAFNASLHDSRIHLDCVNSTSSHQSHYADTRRV